MKQIRSAALLLAAALVLAGCGGGGDGGPPLIEIGMVVNGQPVPSVDVLAGERQQVIVPIGASFELDSTDPVTWTVFVAGAAVPEIGNTITTGGVTLQETGTTNLQFTADTFASSPVPASVGITVLATSLDDPSQVATLDVVLAN